MPLEQVEQVALDHGQCSLSTPKCTSATCRDPAQPVLGVITSHEVSVLEASLFKPWGNESLRLHGARVLWCLLCDQG